MAQISIDYFSSSLMRVFIDILLPFDSMDDALGTDWEMRSDEKGWDRRPYPPERPPFKTLYLLHGITGNHADWISESRIRSWAAARNLAVVMPSGYNAFYLDQPESHNFYGRFVGQELINVTRRILPLSTQREDTFIGGISIRCLRSAARGKPEMLRNVWVSHISCPPAMIADSIEDVINNDVFFLKPLLLSRLLATYPSLLAATKTPRAWPRTWFIATARARASSWRAATPTRSPIPTACSPIDCAAWALRSNTAS